MAAGIAGAPVPEGRAGTVAAAQPRPRSVEEADRLVREGVPRDEAARRLAGSFGGDDLRSGRLWWVQRMPKRTWDDHHAGAVLRVLESASAIAEPLLPAADPRS